MPGKENRKFKNMKLKEPLSKRDYIAIRVLQIFINKNSYADSKEISKYSYKIADSMIEESNKEKE